MQEPETTVANEMYSQVYLKVMGQRLHEAMHRMDRRNPRYCTPRLRPGEYRPVTWWSPTSHSYIPGKNRTEKRANVRNARKTYLKAQWRQKN